MCRSEYSDVRSFRTIPSPDPTRRVHDERKILLIGYYIVNVQYPHDPCRNVVDIQFQVFFKKKYYYLIKIIPYLE